MSDFVTVPSQLAEPNKYGTKFCFAVIPVAIRVLLLLISIIRYAIIFVNNSVSSYIDYIDISLRNLTTIDTILSGLTTSLFWILFSIALFLKRPNNVLIPISLGGALVFPTLISNISYSIISKTEFLEYTISPSTVYYIAISLVAVAICVLFIIKAPAPKAFIKKTGKVWSIVIPLLFIAQCVFYIANVINVYNNLDETAGFSFTEYFLNAELTIFIINFLVYSLEAITLFLLYRWLTNPYKEITPAQPKPAMVSQNPQHSASPVTPAVQPVSQTPAAFPASAQSQAQTTVANEIAKYNTMLDTGTITPEEFEELKAKLINKI